MFPRPPNEAERLAALNTLALEETTQTEHFLPLVRLGRALFSVPELIISVVGEESQRVLAAEQHAGMTFPRAISVCSYTIAGNELFEVPDLLSDARFSSLPYVSGPPFFRFYAGIPLVWGNGLNLGSICVFDHMPRHLDTSHRRQMTDLGRVAASLLRLHEVNASLRRNETHLRNAATTDSLTGCLNRIGMREKIGDLFERASEPNGGAALIYVDVDHFKQVNDRHGHPAGDAVLRTVADRLRGVLRGADLVARIGGDEFCVVLPKVGGVPEVERIAARLVEAFKAPIETEKGLVPCSISVGAAVAPVHGTTREAIAREADAALYRAKEAGRARFRIAA